MIFLSQSRVFLLKLDNFKKIMSPNEKSLIEYLKVTQKSSGDNFNLIFHLTTNFQFIILKIKMSPIKIRF